MSDIKTIEGVFTSGKGNYAVVVGRWNSFVVEHLLEGALDTLKRHGVSEKQIAIVRALGAVIRGGTPHFEYVAGECTKGIAQVGMEHGVPISFGVLTVDSIEQAVERAGTKAGNKGEEAAMSAIEMVDLIQKIG